MAKDVAEIYDTMATAYNRMVGIPIGGTDAGLAAALATISEDLYNNLDEVAKQMFLATCDVNSLYKHGAGILRPHSGIKAKGYVYFYGAIGDVVPEGTIIRDDEAGFITIEPGEVKEFIFTGTATLSGDKVLVNSNGLIPTSKAMIKEEEVDIVAEGDNISFELEGVVEGESLDIKIYRTDAVSVEALAVGKAGNRNFDDVLTTDVVLDVISDSRVVSLSGGQDEETDAEYRNRTIRFMQTPQAPFTESSIRIFLSREVPFLKKIWIRLKEEEVHIIGVDEKLTLTSDEIDYVSKKMDLIRPVDFSKKRLKIYSPIQQEVNIKIKGLRPNIEDLQENITANLHTYFKNLFYEERIYLTQLSEIIMGTTRGAEKVITFDFDFDASVLEEKDNTLFVLGSVEYSL